MILCKPLATTTSLAILKFAPQFVEAIGQPPARRAHCENPEQSKLFDTQK